MNFFYVNILQLDGYIYMVHEGIHHIQSILYYTRSFIIE